MAIENDETLQIYIEESLDHLADIEADFLAIEEAGSDIDEELVNKVYRAAHSIKGGAGFMGLDNIKDLTHEMENILGKIRSREMVPDPEIVNILLLASDAVKHLIDNIAKSNDEDISEPLEALRSISRGQVAEDATVSSGMEEEGPVSGAIDISFPDGKTVFTVAYDDLSSVREEGKYIYLVEIDLIRDVHIKERSPLEWTNEMQQTGIILSSKIDVEAVGTLEKDELPDRIPCNVLFASILKPDDINALFEINETQIFVLAEDLVAEPISEPAPQELPVSIHESESLTEEPAMESAMNKVEAPWSPVEPVDGTEKNAVNAGVQASSIAQSSPGAATPQTASMNTGGDTSLRVHVSLLDSLMTLAGELVLGRNQLLQAMSSDDLRASEVAGQRIDLITSELQEAIMLTRMQPIGNVFNKFPRVVRDLARNLGKEVELILEGKDVELDKTIIEAINDPLTHLVRNSVDHGIETVDERNRAGKRPTGEVLLRAYHEAGQVNIEIRDDGKGLDGGKLVAAALAKGLISEDQTKMMSDKERVNLIFLPGFSTAEEVTDVSGRGVGMDVVKTNLDKLGGVVDIDSRPGRGTNIRIKLPLTLAIIPSQIISTSGERYAIPQVNMEELLRIPADQIKDRIEKVGNADVVRLRGNLLPLVRLADIIGLERVYFNPEDGEGEKDRRENMADRRSGRSQVESRDMKLETGGPGAAVSDGGQEEDKQQDKACNRDPVTRDPEERRYHAASAVNIVVVSTGTLKYGLIVDQLHDSEEIVVKPLGRHLKHCKGYAGATIMGDGRVALILDVAGLSRMAELTSVEGSDRAAEVQNAAVNAKQDMQSLLIFRNAEKEQFSVPLGLVSRIEKIKEKAIEEVGGKRVMQYRGASLPLVCINDVADVKPLAECEDLLVIVFLVTGKEVGLLATSPVDALEASVDFDETTLRQPGIMGSAILDERTTLMVDIFGLVQTLNPDWFAEQETVRTSEEKATTILYAEDSPFFRTQVKGFIEESGYDVIAAEDGMIAWDLLQRHGDEISLVVTDIEMPNLDGLGLTAKIKGDERYSHLPVIGLTTLAGDAETARGKEVGIDDYQVKLDRERLVESIRGFLGR